MWADHFEALGTPSEIATFDKGFFTKVTDSVREVFSTFVNDPNGILCEPLEYEEVARVCSTLKLGVSGVEIDYEHIRYAGPPLWKLLFQLYQNYFDNFSVCDSLLTGVILPLFKGKGAKANNKDNYSLSPGFWQSFISIEVCRDCIPAIASSCKKQLTGFFVCLLFFLKVKRIS